MALGKRKSNASDNFLPLIKYDARTGDLFLLDREQGETGWETKQRDITAAFRAAIDLENLQVGWIKFPKGAAPETQLVTVGEDMGEAPADDWKQGLRVIMKMSPALDGSIRELMGTSDALWNGVSALHDDFLKDAPDHPGELPVVVLAETRQKRTGSSTNYVPVFEIADWIARPADLPGPMPRSTNRSKSDTAQEEIPF